MSLSVCCRVRRLFVLRRQDAQLSDCRGTDENGACNGAVSDVASQPGDARSSHVHETQREVGQLDSGRHRQEKTQCGHAVWRSLLQSGAVDGDDHLETEAARVSARQSVTDTATVRAARAARVWRESQLHECRRVRAYATVWGQNHARHSRSAALFQPRRRPAPVRQQGRTNVRQAAG